MIRIEHVCVTYGSGAGTVHAVRDVSLHIPPGEALGLVGESGSGKSTVMRAVAGLIPHALGRIFINGQDPYGSLHPNQTVDQTLAAPIAIHNLGNAEQRIINALTEVGLGREHRFRYPHQLSGGQRQRVAIARALILEPKVLLLDEPTSALDVSVQAEILNLLTRLRRDHGLTMLMVSHDLAVIAHICDRIGVMSRGELLEMTTATDLAEGRVTHPYSQQLLRANRGFDPTSIDIDVTA